MSITPGPANAASRHDPLDISPLELGLTAPEGCNTSSMYYTSNVVSPQHWRQQGLTVNNASCFPFSGFVVNGYYSPGACPESYTPGCVPNTNSDVDTTVCCQT